MEKLQIIRDNMHKLAQIESYIKKALCANKNFKIMTNVSHLIADIQHAENEDCNNLTLLGTPFCIIFSYTHSIYILTKLFIYIGEKTLSDNVTDIKDKIDKVCTYNYYFFLLMNHQILISINTYTRQIS